MSKLKRNRKSQQALNYDEALGRLSIITTIVKLLYIKEYKVMKKKLKRLGIDIKINGLHISMIRFVDSIVLMTEVEHNYLQKAIEERQKVF